MGYSTDFLDSLVRAQEWTSLLSDRINPSDLGLYQRREQNTYALIRGLSAERPDRGGVLRGRNVYALISRLAQGYADSISFDSLPIPFACVATNIVDNTEVDLRSGSLPLAMRASMSIPGIFTPVRWGDMVLVDGGLQNNLPVDLARSMGADIVISVSVQSPLHTADQITDVATVVSQIVDINCKRKFYENIANSEVFIHVNVEGVSSMSYTAEAMDTMIHRGEAAARLAWDRLVQLRDSNHLLRQPRPEYVPPAVPDKREGHSTRPIGNIPVVSAGFRFDTEETGALQFNLKYPLHTRIPMGVQATLRLGDRLMARGELSWLTRIRGLNPTVSYTFRNNDIDVYTQGDRTFNVRYRSHTVNLTPIDIHKGRYDLLAGARWDHFDYYGGILSTVSGLPRPEDDSYVSYYFLSDLNTEDNWYFPTRGVRFLTSFLYRTDNFLTYQDRAGLLDVSAHWRFNVRLSEHWTLQPMLYGRGIIGEEVPWAFLNTVGGEYFDHRLEQQMPFAGVGHMELLSNYFAAAQLQLQCQLLPRHYLLLRGAIGYHVDDFVDFYPSQMLFGIQGGYTFSSFFGPLSFRLGYSSHTKSTNLYISLGHQF